MAKYIIALVILLYCVWAIFRIKRRKGCSCGDCPYSEDCKRKTKNS